MSKKSNKKYPRGGGNGPITRLKERFIKQEGLCYYCEEPMYIHTEVHEKHPRRATREHKQPRSKGGMGGSNLVYACRSCNTLKREKSPVVFRQLLANTWIAEIEYEGNASGYQGTPTSEVLGSKEARGIQPQALHLVREDTGT